MNAVEIGIFLEDLASEHLQKHGLMILHRNFSCKLGEIDLIAKEGEYLIFTEVRYRKHDLYGSAAETVNWYKQQKLIKAAQFYLQTHHWAKNLYCRFDVIAISGSIDDPKLEWIKDAFNEQE